MLRKSLPALDTTLLRPLGLAACGLGAASIVPAALPGSLGVGIGIGISGLALVSTLLALDAARRAKIEQLATQMGEFNVRLAATRVKLDQLQSRVMELPMTQDDAAPARLALSELTAEVGIVGGLLRDAMTTLCEHENRLAALQAAPAATANTPQPAMMPARVSSADTGPAPEQREAILAALVAGGLDVHLQPIVTLPQRRTAGYELLARLTLAQGDVLTAQEFITVADAAGHSGSIDAQVLTRALALASHLNGRAQNQFVTLNLSAATWTDARQLGSIARIVETYRAQASRLVIEIPQKIFRQLDPSRLGLLTQMSSHGARFALDHLADLRLDPVALAERGVRFVKVPGRLLTDWAERPHDTDIAPADFAAHMRRAGIDLIAEMAETDRMIADAIDLDVRFAQGFAISPARPIRPDAFTAAPNTVNPAEAQADTAPLTPPAAANRRAPQPGHGTGQPAGQSERQGDVQPERLPERLPLRAVLRRA